MEKSVSRTDLDSVHESSPEPVERLEAIEFDFIETASHAERNDAPEADELSFNLFAPTKQRKEAANTVRIRSPTPQLKEAGFIVQQRDPAYYFSSAFEGVAVSFEDVRKLASIKWYGSADPWKVLNLPASGLAKTTRQEISTLWTPLTRDDAKRMRKGKKARIKLRVKLAAAKQKAAETKVAQEAKDAAEREKKTRRNREKKAKKRLRDKAKKDNAQADDDSEGSAD